MSRKIKGADLSFNGIPFQVLDHPDDLFRDLTREKDIGRSRAEIQIDRKERRMDVSMEIDIYPTEPMDATIIGGDKSPRIDVSMTVPIGGTWVEASPDDIFKDIQEAAETLRKFKPTNFLIPSYLPPSLRPEGWDDYSHLALGHIHNYPTELEAVMVCDIERIFSRICELMRVSRETLRIVFEIPIMSGSMGWVDAQDDSTVCIANHFYNFKSIRGFAFTLAHEIQHVKQVREKRLQHIDGVNYWHNEPFSTITGKPWETEADEEAHKALKEYEAYFGLLPAEEGKCNGNGNDPIMFRQSQEPRMINVDMKFNFDDVGKDDE